MKPFCQYPCSNTLEYSYHYGASQLRGMKNGCLDTILECYLDESIYMMQQDGFMAKVPRVFGMQVAQINLRIEASITLMSKLFDQEIKNLESDQNEDRSFKQMQGGIVVF